MKATIFATFAYLLATIPCNASTPSEPEYAIGMITDQLDLGVLKSYHLWAITVKLSKPMNSLEKVTVLYPISSEQKMTDAKQPFPQNTEMKVPLSKRADGTYRDITFIPDDFGHSRF